ncbi:MAG: hypothetical protein RLZZ436_174, partial [Planctomycetota bacterium]
MIQRGETGTNPAERAGIRATAGCSATAGTIAQKRRIPERLQPLMPFVFTSANSYGLARSDMEISTSRLANTPLGVYLPRAHQPTVCRSGASVVSIRIRCICTWEGNINDSLAGKKVRCPDCRGAIQVPAATQPAPPAPPAAPTRPAAPPVASPRTSAAPP